MRYQEVKRLLSKLWHRPLTAACCLLTLVCTLAACSEWDTNGLGKSFVPNNLQVSKFTHLVYVEFSSDDIKIWGPNVKDVVVAGRGNHLVLQNLSDSLALFVYGYTSANDSLGVTDNSITIESDLPYALYLNGLSLHSQQQTAISSTGQGACHLVIPQASKNQLYGGLHTDGDLIVSGTGTLTIESDGNCISASSLYCQYAVTMNLYSRKGDGIELRDGSMKSTLGTWEITAARNGIVASDSIVLLDGSYTGSALEGSFLDAPYGSVLRKPTVTAVSAWSSNVLDSAQVAHYDSVQAVWQEQVDTLTLMADTTYYILRNSSRSQLAKFLPRQTLPAPYYFLLSNSTVTTQDTLYFSKTNK